MKAMSTRNDDPAHASRPFDAQRDGFVMGEGSGILGHRVAPSTTRGARGADLLRARRRVRRPRVTPFHINAAGSRGQGTVDGDEARPWRVSGAEAGPESTTSTRHGTQHPVQTTSFETLAIKKVFGDHAPEACDQFHEIHDRPTCWGAAGGIESVVCVKTIQTGFIAPTIKPRRSPTRSAISTTSPNVRAARRRCANRPEQQPRVRRTEMPRWFFRAL